MVNILWASISSLAICTLSALHDRCLPLSSMAGMNDRVLMVALPSAEALSLTFGIFFEPLYHDICEGGREPLDRHLTSALTPADIGLFGLVIDTSRGFTVHIQIE